MEKNQASSACVCLSAENKIKRLIMKMESLSLAAKNGLHPGP